MIKERFQDWQKQMWPNQKLWDASKTDSYRNILTDRQGGATMAMAIEAAFIASLEGRSQVFIAPNLDQAGIFKRYIEDWYGAEALKALAIEFESPKTITRRYLSDSFDLYIDSYLWMKEEELSIIAKLIETHRPHRTTWLSSRNPSWKLKLLEQATHK